MTAIPLTQGGPADHENYETHWTGPYLEVHMLSDIGKKRHHNEDACVMCIPEDRAILEDRGMLFAVADGMGGASAGELASRLALETTSEEYYESPKSTIPALLEEALAGANRRIFVESGRQEAFRGMGTTVSVLLIHGENAYIAQVGDSRVYIKREDEDLVQITDDHSLVAEQVRIGNMSAREARNHAMKNLITRAVGIKETVKVDLFSLKLKVGDTLLICSDGLSNLVEDEEIEKALAEETVTGAARVLLGHALNHGGTDNITAVVVHVTQVPPIRDLQEGAVEVPIGATGFLGRIRHLLHKNPR